LFQGLPIIHFFISVRWQFLPLSIFRSYSSLRANSVTACYLYVIIITEFVCLFFMHKKCLVDPPQAQKTGSKKYSKPVDNIFKRMF